MGLAPVLALCAATVALTMAWRMYVSASPAVAGGGLAASFSAVMSVSGSWQIKGNIANNGGGIWMSGTASLALNHANVTGNTALRIGGAITAEGRATAVASNGTRVSGNAAIEGGGAYLDSTGRWVFDGVSFVENAAATSGRRAACVPGLYHGCSHGVMLAGRGPDATVLCVWRLDPGGGLYLQVLANTTFTNCSWARNTAAVTGGAVHGGLSAGSSVSVSQALASVLPATTATLVATFHSCSFRCVLLAPCVVGHSRAVCADVMRGLLVGVIARGCTATTRPVREAAACLWTWSTGGCSTRASFSTTRLRMEVRCCPAARQFACIWLSTAHGCVCCCAYFRRRIL